MKSGHHQTRKNRKTIKPLNNSNNTATKNNKRESKNKTRFSHGRESKTRFSHKGICGSILESKEGWKTICVYGDPYDRGFAHGYLLREEFRRVLKILPFVVKTMLKVSMTEYMKKSNELIKPVIQEKYPEFFKEIEGISDGLKAGGIRATSDFIIAWNSYMTLYSVFLDGSIENQNDQKSMVERCSAFIATGSATKDGKIVMGHTTHSDFATASLFNIIMYVVPMQGHPFVMQTSPGYIASVSDWFISTSGIIGCETTISSINYKPEFGTPFFCRIRQAMQYANTLDQYVEIMLHENAGDYACSWQFGDINSNEIMLFEIGLKTHAIQRTKDGIFYGMNSAIDKNLRTLETDDKDFDDITKSTGARNLRLNYLLNEKYNGRIDAKVAQLILSDHYDVFENKVEMNTRSICRHTELDPTPTKRPGYYPFGCTDAKVTTADMARQMSFMGRFGSACGRDFNVKKYIRDHPIFKEWQPFLTDFPKTAWHKLHLSTFLMRNGVRIKRKGLHSV